MSPPYYPAWITSKLLYCLKPFTPVNLQILYCLTARENYPRNCIYWIIWSEKWKDRSWFQNKYSADAFIIINVRNWKTELTRLIKRFTDVLQLTITITCEKKVRLLKFIYMLTHVFGLNTTNVLGVFFPNVSVKKRSFLLSMENFYLITKNAQINE